MYPELHRGLSRIFGKKTHIRLLFAALLPIAFSVQTSYAQSGIGVGLVFSTPHAGGVSVRYKSIQVIVGGNIGGGINAGTDVTLTELAVRYNRSIRDLKRVNLKVFGQVGRHEFPELNQELDLPTLYRFTGGGSAELRIGRKPSLKGLFLTVDLGLSIDHKGNLGASPARGIALHYFF
ncbi:MAG: hypothetical protein F4069_04535 [Rhodothermaceae bacterium]|nr:hypothetical protein [Rhodothermaceae bacterium]MYG69405.1 hypothetical protein [Rhodothermaceae bacterium]MYJ44582.1 hypothetical protein [Rhodothermaceae bacterium]